MLSVKRQLIPFKKDLKVQQLPFKYQNWIVSSEDGHFRFKFEVYLKNVNKYLALATSIKIIIVYEGILEIDNHMITNKVNKRVHESAVLLTIQSIQNMFKSQIHID